MASVFGRTIAVPDAGIGPIVRRPAVLAVALAVIGILAVHAETAGSIVAIWMRSETFAHGFVVVPLALWLTWRRRDALSALAAQPWFPGIALILLFGAAWLASTLADVQAGRQFALAFMLQAAILTVVGLRIAREIAFPLAFALFAVPFGEFMIPTMIDWTADFTVLALRASGVPVYREANHFVIPSGSWSVVEACSGIRYLIVSVVIGAVYAMTSYRSARPRALFIIAAIVVPLVANWLRAYGIVMLGHLSNNKLAVGVDHLVYGWLFFGLVMLVLFWVGSFWQDPEGEPVTAARPASTSLAPAAGRPALLLAAGVAVAAAGLWVPLPAWIERATPAEPVTLTALEGAGGWAPSTEALTTWKPNFAGHAAERQQTFVADTRMAGVYIAFYRAQGNGRELVTSKHALVSRHNWSWKQLDAGSETLEWRGRTVVARRAVIGGQSQELLVYQLYWVDGRFTSSDYIAKVMLTWAKLRGRGDDSALVVFYAPWSNDVSARPTLRGFVAAMAPQVERVLEAASGGTQR